MSWQDQYENAADHERQEYDALTVDALLDAVERGQYGQYNMIWYVLAERATLQQAASTLFRTLQRDEVDYLIRCNCAETLLSLLGHDDDPLQCLQDAVNLSNGKPAERLPYLTAIKQEIAERSGIIVD